MSFLQNQVGIFTNFVRLAIENPTLTSLFPTENTRNTKPKESLKIIYLHHNPSNETVRNTKRPGPWFLNATRQFSADLGPDIGLHISL